jgi:hypothetical protein
MKNKILVGAVLATAVLIAGSAFAEDRGPGADGNQIGDRPALAQTKLEGGLEVKGDVTVEGRVPRPKDLGEQEDGGRMTISATGTASGTRVRFEDRQKEREIPRISVPDNEKSNRGTSTREAEREDNRERATSSREDDKEKSATSTEGERSREEHRSVVAKAVQELLNVAGREGGIGEQVRTIAKSQQENHDKINESLKRVEDRGALRKFFFGPDQVEIDSAKQLVASNEAQIKLLTDLKTRMATGTDQTTIDTQIKLLQGVNLAASTTLSVHESGFSVFGWMFRLFGR